MELTIENEPFIIISLQEISHMHQLLVTHIDQIDSTNDDKDLLRQILKDLGDVPVVPEKNTTEIQLGLEPKSSNIEGEGQPVNDALYNKVKSEVINIYRIVPLDKSSPTTLMGSL